MKQGKPFIIWTLQRTGGTNLARRLFEACGLLPADRDRPEASSPVLERITDQWKLHEPFNYGQQARVFGDISRRWVEDGNDQALEQSISEIVGLRLPLKHCVEMVPWRITEVLARESCRAGYAHVFLYRREAVDRLLSLHFAKMSGVWGPHFSNQSELDDRIYGEALPVAELAGHESFCAQTLENAWKLLQACGASPFALAYEDIYKEADPEQVFAQLGPVLRLLGLTKGGTKDRRFIDEILSAGDQGTRDKYARFAGIERLAAAVASGARFRPRSDTLLVELRMADQRHPEIVHAAVDLVPAAVRPGQVFELGGVVVMNSPGDAGSRLKLRQGDEETDIAWNIKSPRMARLYPASPNSGAARFKQGGVHVDGKTALEVILCKGSGARLTVASLQFKRTNE